MGESAPAPSLPACGTAHPFMDIVPIPYSKQALGSYRIIIHGLQLILKDMVDIRKICIQRNLTRLIPNQRYDIANLSLK